MVDSDITQIKGIGPKAAKTLEDCGFNTIEKIAKAKVEEMAQLPGIGQATAEKIITAAKEIAKPPAKKPAPKKEVKPEKAIPKPPAVKKAVTEKPPTKTTARPSVKKPAAKPATKPTTKTETKPSKMPVKISATPSTLREIERAREIPKIKPKRKSTAKKTKKKAKLKPTFGIVRSVVHDRTGRTKNRSVIVSFQNIEAPLESYLGKKVRIQMKSGKELLGVISKIHGKKSSKENSVVVRFNKSVSPHIVTSRAEVF
jgi:NAD-dependent DNA ligase